MFCKSGGMKQLENRERELEIMKQDFLAAQRAQEEKVWHELVFIFFITTTTFSFFSFFFLLIRVVF